MASSAPNEKTPKKRNAYSTVTELMGPRRKIPTAKPHANPTTASTPNATSSQAAETFSSNRRNGLGIYIANPTSFPSIVISHTPHFITMRDGYPKSSVHLLVLPRSPFKTHLHPFLALNNSDPEFLTAVRAECAKAKELAASELRRRYGKYSAQDQAREAALSDPDADSDAELPPGRDWAASIRVGVHAVPSMANLHIHIISVDRYSESLKHRKHYNSFATPVFVPLEDFPLAEDDVRRWSGREGYLKRDFVCWRCGMEFGKQFKRLKEHLEEEFEEWKKE